VGAVALVASIAGAVLALGGTAFVRVWAFPLALSLFMVPKLAVVYNQVTLPLQLAATRIAAGMLRLLGVTVAVDGNILVVAGRQVVVEEACNGLRFLLSLGLLAVMIAWFRDPKPWMRWALLASAVPLAIAANALRVASAAWLASLNPAYVEGWFHTWSGAAVFLLCLPALAGVNRLLNGVYKRLHAV
jgi:exosortase